MRSEGARDFPFQPGEPAPSALRWAAALGLTAVGVAALMAAPRLFGPDQAWAGVAIFVAAPLAGLALLLNGRPGRVFIRPTGWDFLIGVGFGLLNLAVTIGAACWPTGCCRWRPIRSTPPSRRCPRADCPPSSP